MRMYFKNLITFCLFLMTLVASGQKTSVNDRRAFADDMMDIGEFHVALDIYNDLIKNSGPSPDLYYRLGICTTEEYDEIEALKFFEKALELGEVESVSNHLRYDSYKKRFYSYNINFNMARGYHRLSRFAKAIKHYKLFLLNELDLEDRVDSERMLQNAKNGWYLKKNRSFKGRIINLGEPVNSIYNDYGSLVHEDSSTIIYTREQPNNHFKSIRSDGSFKEDVYIVKKRTDGTWFEPYRLSAEINKDKKDDAAIALSDNDSRLIIQYQNGNLFESLREGSGWSPPVKLPKFINSLNDETGLTFGDRVMIISSNRAGTYGGQDLFVSIQDSTGGWSYLEQLDTLVNTAFDEFSPYLDPQSNTLYFSSKGHNSMGGFDVFKSLFDPVTKTWGAPENIGYPINTPEDETFFSYRKGSNVAYYSSSRTKGYGGMDLYKIDYQERDGIETRLLSGIVHGNGKDKTPLQASIIIKDALSERLPKLELNSNAKGKFSEELVKGKSYMVSIHNDGYFHIDTLITMNDDFLLDVELDPIEEGEIIPLSSVNFEKNKYKLPVSAYDELDRYYKVLVANPLLGLEIAGHTEIGGISSQNKELSQNRADAVKEFLVNRGIDKNRLLSVGYGSKYPLSKSSSKSGANRRTELILHRMDAEDWEPYYK